MVVEPCGIEIDLIGLFLFSIGAYCLNVKLCVLATWAFQSQ